MAISHLSKIQKIFQKKLDFYCWPVVYLSKINPPMKTKKINAPLWYYDYLVFNDGSNMSPEQISEIQSFMDLHKIVKFKSIDYSNMTGSEITYVCTVKI